MRLNSDNNLVVFNGTNYAEWSVKMCVHLQSKGLWFVVEDEALQEDSEQGKVAVFKDADVKARGMMCKWMDTMNARNFIKFKTAKTIWEGVENTFQAKSVNSVMMWRKEFQNLKMKEGDDLMKYIARLEELQELLKGSEGAVADSVVTITVMAGLPNSWKTYASGLRSVLVDLSDWFQIKNRLIEEWQIRCGDANADEDNGHQGVFNVGGYSGSNGGNGGYNGSNGGYSGSNGGNGGYSGSNGGNGGYSGSNGGNGGYSGSNGGYSGSNGGNGGQFRKKRFIGVCDHCKKIGHKKVDCWAPGGGSERKRPSFGGSANLTERRDERTRDEYFIFNAGKNEKEVDSSEWFLDSGCALHLTHSKDIMEDFKSIEPMQLMVAEKGRAIDAIGIGNIKFVTGCGKKILLENVYYVPKLNKNLVSQALIDRKGFSILCKGGELKIVDGKNTAVITGNLNPNDLYCLDIKALVPVDMKINTNVNQVDQGFAKKVSSEVWHRRLGHLNLKMIKKMETNNVVDGVRIDDTSPMNDCIACLEGKMRRLSFSNHHEPRTSSILELIHSDVCGPILRTNAFGKPNYFVTFIDDHSHFLAVYPLVNKSDVLEKFQVYCSFIENLTGNKIKRLRSDNGGEYISKDMKNFLIDKGIVLDTTVPYTPQQNGKSERMNLTLGNMIRSMLSNAQMAKEHWKFALLVATYTLNRCLSTATGEKLKTPFELIYKKKPNLGNMRIFGCMCLVLVPKSMRAKFDSRTIRARFVGYTSTGYILLREDGKLISSRDVKFQESIEEIDDPSSSEDEFAEDIHKEGIETVAETVASEFTLDSDDGTDSWHSGVEEIVPVVPETRPRTRAAIKAIQQEQIRNMKDTGTRAVQIANVLLTNPVVDVNRYSEPISYKEAMSRNEPEKQLWMKAMQEEMDSLEVNETWVEVNRPENRTIIPNKWVYKVKKNSDGSIERYKARLVAKGFKQVHGIDYFETYAPVAESTTIRMILSLATNNKWDLLQWDVKTAFLYGEVKEELFVALPEGFSTNASRVGKLKKSLYGLKQAPRNWNLTLTRQLEAVGYQQLMSDPCVFLKRKDHLVVIMFIYVDDIGIATNWSEEVNRDFVELQKHFQIKDLGNMAWLMGMAIIRDDMRASLIISQEQYLNTKINEFNLSDAATASTPMEHGLKLEKGQRNQGESSLPYRELIGSLLYAAKGTRPDIGFAVGYLSRYLDCYGNGHVEAAKRVFKYLNKTVNHCLTYTSVDGELEIKAFVDADYSGSHDDGKSTTGFAIYLNDNLISWHSKKQTSVAVSTVVAEYIGCAEVVQELLWIKEFLKELGMKESKPSTLYCDNQTTTEIIKGNAKSKKTRHVNAKYYFVKEHCSNGNIQILYCNTSENTADILTKALQRNIFEKHKENLGVRELRGNVEV